jgi:hypothetical protein
MGSRLYSHEIIEVVFGGSVIHRRLQHTRVLTFRTAGILPAQAVAQSGPQRESPMAQSRPMNRIRTFGPVRLQPPFQAERLTTLFSHSSELLVLQPLCLDNLLNCRGGGCSCSSESLPVSISIERHENGLRVVVSINLARRHRRCLLQHRLSSAAGAADSPICSST